MNDLKPFLERILERIEDVSLDRDQARIHIYLDARRDGASPCPRCRQSVLRRPGSASPCEGFGCRREVLMTSRPAPGVVERDERLGSLASMEAEEVESRLKPALNLFSNTMCESVARRRG